MTATAVLLSNVGMSHVICICQTTKWLIWSSGCLTNTYDMGHGTSQHLTAGVWLTRCSGRSQRYLLDDLQAVRLQGDEFSRVVGKNPHRVDVQRGKDLRSDAVFALLAAKGDRFVRVHTLLAMKIE